METVDVASQRPANAGTTSAKPAFTKKEYLVVFIFVTSLFMLWGVAITMGDILNRHFQNVLHLTKAQSGLVQFSIFGAYFVMGIPAGYFMKRFGYKNGVLLGLALYAIGAFLFIPSANAESFLAFRGALFVLGCGLATLETVAHPFIASLGDQRTSDQRINFAQSFNGLGTIIGPLIGSYFILRVGYGAENDLTSVKVLYTVIGSLILLVAVSFSFVKVPPLAPPHSDVSGAEDLSKIQRSGKKLFQHKHFIWAVVAQFFNVAAQIGTWAYFVIYGAENGQYARLRSGELFRAEHGPDDDRTLLRNFPDALYSPQQIAGSGSAGKYRHGHYRSPGVRLGFVQRINDDELFYEHHVPDHL